MKFGLYLATHSRDIWRQHYINYKEMKKIVKQVLHAPYAVYVPTQLSFAASFRTPSQVPGTTVTRKGGSGPRPVPDRADLTPQEQFFITLEKEVHRLDIFIKNIASLLRDSLTELQASISHADLSDSGVKEQLMLKARELSNEYLHLEKFVNLNYAALQKILKKHDKLVPNAPCFHFYMSHISSQPWVRGDHHDLQVTLTRIFSTFHRVHGVVDVSLLEHNYEEHTQRFWVKREDLVQVKHMLLQHLPASDVPHPEDAEDDWAIVNHVALDNSSLELYHSLLYGRPYCNVVQLRWRGLGSPETVQVQRKTYKDGWRPEVSVKDSFPLKEEKVADFLKGRWTFADARKYLMQQQQQEQQQQLLLSAGTPLSLDGGILATPSQTEAERLVHEYHLFKTFTEVQRLVESKALQPMVRIVHRETVFEEAKVPGLAGRFRVEVHEDVEAVLEYSYDGMHRLANGVWRQEAPADRLFLPYAVIHVHTPPGTQAPSWLQKLIADQLLIEVHDFSKMLFAMAGLMPDMVRAVPVWIDDTKIQKTLFANIMQHQEADGSVNDPFGRLSATSSFKRDTTVSLLPDSPHQPSQPTAPKPAQQLNQQLSSSGRKASGDGSKLSAPRKLAPESSGFGFAGWQAKLVERTRSQNNVYQAQMMVEETDHYMQNERMLLTWLRLAILVGGLAVIMLNFAAKSYSDPTEAPTIHISETTAFVLLFCAICICSYGIGSFIWRGSHMYQARIARYDDTVGTLWLNLVLILAFLGLFLINIADLVEDTFTP